MLFGPLGLDERYWFHDETRTKLAMLRHYQESEPRGAMLYEPRATPRDLLEVGASDAEGVLGTAIPVAREPDTLWLTNVEVQYSLLGRLARFFYTPPILRVTLRLANGKVITYRAVVPIVNGGIVLNSSPRAPKTRGCSSQERGGACATSMP